ncbi:MAG TPA: SPW repeat protein, partial [Vicinamibacterales bacterium]
KGFSMKRVSWLNFGLGIWLVCAPFVLHTTGIAVINSILIGVAVIVLATLSLRAPLSSHLPAWLNLAAGFWVFFSPWILHFNAQTPAVVKGALTGALIMIFAIARASSSVDRYRLT